MRTEKKKWLAFFALMVACCTVAYVIGSSGVCGACQKELCPDEYRWGPSPAWNWDPEPDIFVGRQEVRFENRTQEKMFNVTATVTCVPVNVEATDTQVSLGDIPAGESAWSSDTFELRVDMTNPQEPNNGIVWKGEYDDAETGGNHYVVENIPSCTGSKTTGGETPT